jgi:PPOX class probable FMN-dependent enzyme
MSEICSLTELLATYPEPSMLAFKKELAHIDRQARAFIARSSFLVIATADADGWPDASPRGDPPGFVVVEDEHRLLMPDRPGNNRVDSFRNLVVNPKIGMLFFVPGHAHSLRINGEARIVTDTALRERFAVNGKPARAVVEVTARQVFFHCGKSLIRSKLWDPEHWPSRDGLLSLGRAIADQVPGIDGDKAEAFVAESIRERLY